MRGISERQIADVPIAVVDIETTGLTPQGDRIVEISVARVEPGEAGPRIVLDTLVNPGRKVSATEIHGVTDADVQDAPTFDQIAPAVSVALRDAVFAAYNVYFDAKFVSAELALAGINAFPPYLCLMYMRPLLDIGSRCSLSDACSMHGVPHKGLHVAADDALASAHLWAIYLDHMRQLQIRTFAELACRRSYKFVRSFEDASLLTAVHENTNPPPFKSRSAHLASSTRPPAGVSDRDGRAEYWNCLKVVLADLDVTAREIDYLADKQRDLCLSDAEIRSLHARAFAGILAAVTNDHVIDDIEVEKVAAMADGLRRLGWSPGDRMTARPTQQRSGSRTGILARLLGR